MTNRYPRPCAITHDTQTDLTRDALAYATQMHKGQLRKYSGLPYIQHPIAVARLLRRRGHDQHVIAGALLHDVVEDTSATLEDVIARFGPIVGRYVHEVTDVSRPSDGNRETRKALDRAHVSFASPGGQSIKAADLCHNSLSIMRYDQHFARTYIPEKELVLDVLERADPALVEMARRIVARWHWSQTGRRKHRTIRQD